MKKDRNDGMDYPSIDKLLSRINSKYKLAYTAAKVAHEIISKDLELEDVQSITPVGQALEEIIKGRVHVEFDEEE